MKINIKWIYIFAAEIVILILSLWGNNVFLITLIILIWLNLVIYMLEDLRHRSFMLMFLVAFFTFLIGRQALERFGLHTIVARFSDEINNQVEVMLLISLVSLAIAYIFLNNKSDHTMHNGSLLVSNQNISIRKASVAVFYITYGFNIYTIFDVIRYVFAYGYLNYYVSYSSSVPLIIEEIGEMNNVAFWIFLSDRSNPRSLKFSITAFLMSSSNFSVSFS